MDCKRSRTLEESLGSLSLLFYTVPSPPDSYDPFLEYLRLALLY